MRKEVLLIGMFLFAAGCTKPDSAVESSNQPPIVDVEEVSELKDKIIRLEKSLIDTQESIEVLEQMIMSHDGLGYGELRRSQYMLEDLIRHLPDIEIRTGFIRQVEDGSMTIDFAEKVESPNAPNGFEIVNEKEEAEVIPITKELTVFVLNGTDLEARTTTEFDSSRHFFFEFFIARGRIIQVRELYVP